MKNLIFQFLKWKKILFKELKKKKKKDFDKQKHENDIFNEIFNEVRESFINGNFFDVEEDVIATPLN